MVNDPVALSPAPYSNMQTNFSFMQDRKVKSGQDDNSLATLKSLNPKAFLELAKVLPGLSSGTDASTGTSLAMNTSSMKPGDWASLSPAQANDNIAQLIKVINQDVGKAAFSDGLLPLQGLT